VVLVLVASSVAVSSSVVVASSIVVVAFDLAFAVVSAGPFVAVEQPFIVVFVPSLPFG
jgi:hypothetical protein